ncbi:MAG: hypothetical protein SD837_16865 [Candidatus Electrothrix scaldis]|nr:MAG: hypothetical protein SD837_16865 [Candidatus Electrothrix sp. GW3-3]
MNKLTCLFVSVLISIFLFGCLERDLTFQIQYEQLQGLKKDNFIYFQGNQIGKIQKISYRPQGDYLIDVSIQSGFKHAATVDSRFYIGDDPVIADNKALIVEQSQAGGTVIARGALVRGSVSEGIVQHVLSGFIQEVGRAGNAMQSKFEQVKESLVNTSLELSAQLQGALEDVSRQLDALNQQVQGVPDSEEVQKLEQSIQEFANSLNKSADDVHRQVENQLVPALQNELEQLRERLQRVGREEDAHDVQKMIDEL